jgi:hypothetical protein
MATYLDRYQHGECEQVWVELVALGDQVRAEPLYAEALAVARETMRRARRNIEMLVERLNTIGFHFYQWGTDIHRNASPDEVEDAQRLMPVFAPPSAQVHSIIAAIEEKAGMLPLSLRAFYEIVGTVRFAGSHQEWQLNGHHLDALEVHSAELALEGYDDWGTEDGEYRMSVPISADEYHKDGMSGAGPYTIVLPEPGMDARLQNEWHRTTFANYLRECFRWGGFPGWARMDQRPGEDLAFLTRDLLPI